MQGNVDILINEGASQKAGPDTFIITGGGSSDIGSDLLIDIIELASYRISGIYYLFQGTKNLLVPSFVTNGYVYLNASGVHVSTSLPPDEVIIIATFDSDETEIIRYSPYYGTADNLESLIEDRTTSIIPTNKCKITVGASGVNSALSVTWSEELYVMLTNSKAGVAQYNVIVPGNFIISNNSIAYVIIDRGHGGALLSINQVDLPHADLGINAVPVFYNKDGALFAPRIPGFLPGCPGYIYDAEQQLRAEYINYVNTGSGLLSPTVQGAISELKELIDVSIRTKPVYDTVTPAVIDTPPPLSEKPFDSSQVLMTVNGIAQNNGYSFSVTMNGVVSWHQAQAGFHLEPGDVISYYYDRVVE
jgi:hypothetical protein